PDLSSPARHAEIRTSGSERRTLAGPPDHLPGLDRALHGTVDADRKQTLRLFLVAPEVSRHHGQLDADRGHDPRHGQWRTEDLHRAVVAAHRRGYGWQLQFGQGYAAQ